MELFSAADKEDPTNQKYFSQISSELVYTIVSSFSAPFLFNLLAHVLTSKSILHYLMRILLTDFSLFLFICIHYQYLQRRFNTLCQTGKPSPTIQQSLFSNQREKDSATWISPLGNAPQKFFPQKYLGISLYSTKIEKKRLRTLRRAGIKLS